MPAPSRFAPLLLLSAVLTPAAFAQASFGHPATPQLRPVVVNGSGESCSDDGLCLAVTVALTDIANPDACGTETSLVANVGDQISWCYTLTNHTGHALGWHTLSDSLHGTLFSEVAEDVEDGQSTQYVKREVAGQVVAADIGATWIASASQPSYAYDDGAAYDFIDIGDGTPLTFSQGFSGAFSQGVTAPFPINFFGTVTDQLCVGANGAIAVGTEVCILPTVYGLPTNYVSAAISPAWSEFADAQSSGTGGAGAVYTKLVGDVPGQRKFVVEWKDMRFSSWLGDMDGFTFEVVYDEASQGYLFQYQSMGDGSGNSCDAGNESVAGMQATPMSGQIYSSFQPQLTPGKAVLWTLQQPDDISTANADVNVDIGAPQLGLPIPQLDAFAATGVAITQPLVILNTGNRVLDWSAGEYPATSLVKHPRRAPVAIDAAAARGTPPRFAPRIDATTAHAGPASVLGAAGIPAFATQVDATSGAQDFIGFNLLQPDPGAANVIVPDLDLAGVLVAGGDFVDNDFSKEWIVDWYWTKLYTLDTATGEQTLIGWLTPSQNQPNESWWGAAWDPATGNFYAVTNADNGWSGLYQIDRATSTATFIGRIDDGASVTTIADIAVDWNGQMYGLDTQGDVLVAIDKASGQSSVIGPLGVDAKYAQSMKFDHSTGTLYWAAYGADSHGAIATIDTVTGAATALAPSGDARELVGLAIAKAGGDCTQPVDLPWLSLDVTSGTLDPNGAPAMINVGFDATTLAAGDYDATICVFSNDPAYSAQPARVPVHFNVAPGGVNDAIFADGFDG